MKNLFRASVILCCVGLLPVSVAHAAVPPNVVAESDHTVAGGRAVEVTVGQAEIKSNIVPSNVAAYTGGGLLAGLIQASVDSDRAKNAELAITPVRNALMGFDADGLAIATTKNAIASVDWLQTDAVKFTKDASIAGKSSVLDAGEAAQVAFFDYSYDISSDFSSARVVITIQFVDKALPKGSSKPEVRFRLNELSYSQTITSVVLLPNPDKDITVNASRWAADDAKLVRSALTLAFANAEKMVPRTLALTDAEIKTMKGKDKPYRLGGGFPGRLQEEDSAHQLLWADGFILVVPMPEAQ